MEGDGFISTEKDCDIFSSNDTRVVKDRLKSYDWT